MESLMENFSNLNYVLGGLSIFFMMCAAFFTGSEIAFISCDRLKLEKYRKEGDKRASLALVLLSNVETLLTTTQFGTNLSITSAITLATILSMNLTNGENDLRLVLVMTPIILMFCDSLPKVMARAIPLKISLFSAYPILLISGFFSPFIWLITFYTTKISNFFGIQNKDTISSHKKTREDLFIILDSESEENELKITQKRMIRKSLEFSHQTVKQAMIPLVKVDAIEKSALMEAAIDLFSTLRHSRIPVYEERVDNIIGVLDVTDIFQCTDDQQTVEKFMRKVNFVPEFQQLSTLIKEMNNSPMVIVVDEYGGAVGMITKEDIFEEVVGNMEDEFDEYKLVFRQISKNSYFADVNIEVDDINERLDMNLPKGDYETLAGFLLQQFNRIPEANDELFFANVKFRVFRATKRAIQSVIITRMEEKDGSTKK